MGGKYSSLRAPIDAGLAVNYKSLEEVAKALAHAGLESTNLIVGIDFTKSNEWTGTESFNRRSLHHIGDEQNPYEQAMSIIGKALASFNENNSICCFGFGDATTRDRDIFSFYANEKLCNGYEEVLRRYRELVPHVQLAGPTSFAPVIEMAITVVEKSGGLYHVLLIIADGKSDTLHEGKTFDAIVKASKYPLSIILVGVGDGPWESMGGFLDNIPARDFDNFQFVNFTEMMSRNMDQSQKEAEFSLSRNMDQSQKEAKFSLAGLMKLPSQYRKIRELNLLDSTSVSRGITIHRVPLPPPMHTSASLSTGEPSIWSSLILSAPSSDGDHTVCTICFTNPEDMAFGCGHQICCACGVRLESCPFCRHSIETRFKLSYTAGGLASTSIDASYNQICPICLTNRKDMAFGCGHQTCCDCGEDLEVCPICRRGIETRIRLY